MIGERRWVIFTKDKRLRYRPLEIAALRAANARVFVLIAGNLTGTEIPQNGPRAHPPALEPPARNPADYSWPTLVELDGIPLEIHYRRTLENLSKAHGPRCPASSCAYYI